MISLKYSCSCGKRILAPLSHLHESKPCPKCQEEVTIPGFGEEGFLLFICECGEQIEHFQSNCSKCSLKIPVKLKPKAQQFRSPLKMKIRCACGKRMIVWARATGKQEDCPKCQKKITIPPSTAVNVLHFICDCGNYVSVREEQCSQCQKPLYQSPFKEIKDANLASKENAVGSSSKKENPKSEEPENLGNSEREEEEKQSKDEQASTLSVEEGKDSTINQSQTDNSSEALSEQEKLL